MSVDKYDIGLVTVEEEIHQLAKKKLENGESFLLYSLPNNEAHLAGLHDEAAIFPLRKWDDLSSLDFNDLPNEAKSVKDFPKETNYRDYSVWFKSFQQAFSNSRLRKAILSTVLIESRPQSFDAIEFFERLRTTYPKAFVYLINHPTEGLWCGATPELLLEKKGNRYQTVALAGSQPLKDDQNYSWKGKEIHEQETVSEHIRDILSGLQIKNLEESEPYSIEAGKVVHLKTDFTFDFEGDPIKLADKLHPTPAIAGLPVKDSMELINEVERHDRGLYTGYLGISTEDYAALFVNLRCMRIGDSELALYVGGGITSESKLEDEWNETRLKAQTLLNLINRSN